MLKQRGVKHEVLNAKFHEKEAQIVAQAGRKGAVTIATNMAGRGTDILLGGNAEFMAKAEMQRMGFTEEQLVESTAYSHTEDEEILKARETFAELNQKYKSRDRPRGPAGPGAGGPVYHRHRAPRVPPDRQPAPGPCRPPGRPGQKPVLHLPGGRPDAPLRRRAPPGHDEHPEDRRRHPHRGQNGLRLHRERPAQGGEPQLRHPQKRAPVRRGDELPAPDYLRPA